MQILECLPAIEAGLVSLGYSGNLLLRNYRFSNLTDAAAGGGFDAIDLAAFAVNPPSYSSACLGVILAPPGGISAERIGAYRFLGSPRLLVVSGKETTVWAPVAAGPPVQLETFANGKDALALKRVIEKRTDWEPRTVLRGKSSRPVAGSGQPDYYGAGLLPAIENEVQGRLDSLLMSAASSAERIYGQRFSTEPDADFYAGLFPLIFRCVAAKMLGDRGVRPDIAWASPDAASVIAAVEHFYFSEDVPKSWRGIVLADPDMQKAAWDTIRGGLRFDNLSVEALATVYENTFVDKDSRRDYGTHATPREVAEFVLRHLPIEELPKEERTIFEPFAGAAPFLVAGLARLRALLPANINDVERHSYLVRMLRSMEFDTFACEIAWYSLILADYPNPNGWTVTRGDIFGAEAAEFERLRADASVVLCNPPYERFTAAERADYGTENGVSKAVRSLNLVLQKPPRMLAFVLPRVAVNGQSYRSAHATLNRTYGNVDILELPDRIFKKSQMETILLLAYGAAQDGGAVRRHARVKQAEYPAALDGNGVVWRLVGGEDASLDNVLAQLSKVKNLDDVAETHRGVEYHGTVPVEDRSSKMPRDGFHPGLLTAKGYIRPYVLPEFPFINLSLAVIRRGAGRDWSTPKVLANYGRMSVREWTISAMVDRVGLAGTDSFLAISPRDETISLEVIAAVMNGPVANTWIKRRSTGRHNQLRNVLTVPIPTLERSATKIIEFYVLSHRVTSAQLDDTKASLSSAERSKLELLRDDLMLRMDAAILSGYALAPESEAELLARFDGLERPGTKLIGYPADRWLAAKDAWQADLVAPSKRARGAKASMMAKSTL